MVRAWYGQYSTSSRVTTGSGVGRGGARTPHTREKRSFRGFSGVGGCRGETPLFCRVSRGLRPRSAATDHVPTTGDPNDQTTMCLTSVLPADPTILLI